MSTDDILTLIDDSLPDALDRLMEFLRIPSISTDPAYAKDCQTAADWLVADLQSIGIAAQKRPTPGHPMVVAHVDGPGPHLLFYGTMTCSLLIRLINGTAIPLTPPLRTHQRVRSSAGADHPMTKVSS